MEETQISDCLNVFRILLSSCETNEVSDDDPGVTTGVASGWPYVGLDTPDHTCWGVEGEGDINLKDECANGCKDVKFTAC